MWGAGGGGVVVSEFSGAWCKREDWVERRERVELPDSLMNEACPSVCWSSPGDSAVSSLMAAD